MKSGFPTRQIVSQDWGRAGLPVGSEQVSAPTKQVLELVARIRAERAARGLSQPIDFKRRASGERDDD